MSWIRSSRLLIRGDRGELVNNTVRWLPKFNAPARQELSRFDGGEPSGTSASGLFAGRGMALPQSVWDPSPARRLHRYGVYVVVDESISRNRRVLL